MRLLSKDSPAIPFLLLFLGVACWAEMDLFAPSLPQIMKDFGTNERIIQWTFSLNFFGFFVSSLFVGPLADAFGRRKILLIGSAIFAFGGVLSVLAPNIEVFLLARFIQGIGVSAPAVVPVAVMGDMYQGEKQVKLMSLINSFITVTMAIAPIAGAFIAEFMGWRANFAVICALAIVGLLVVWFLVPETLAEEHRRRFYVKDLLTNYRRLLTSKSFLLPMGGLCALVTPYFVFIGVIPLIFIDELGVPMSEYVFYQGAVVGCFSLFSLLTPVITAKIDMQKLNRFSIAMTTVAAILLGLHGFLLPDQPLSITALMCFYVIGLVLPCSVMFVKALEVYPDLRASASALCQSMRMLALAAGTYVTGMLYNSTYAPIGSITAILVVIGCVIVLPVIRTSNQTLPANTVPAH